MASTCLRDSPRFFGDGLGVLRTTDDDSDSECLALPTIPEQFRLSREVCSIAEALPLSADIGRTNTSLAGTPSDLSSSAIVEIRKVGMLPTRPSDDVTTGVRNDGMLRPLLESSGVLLRSTAELCMEEECAGTIGSGSRRQARATSRRSTRSDNKPG